MVIRPDVPAKSMESSVHARPVWTAISERQQMVAPVYWLIRQHEHARLAGDLAGMFRANWLPQTSPQEIEAIREHDCGWNFLPFEHGTNPELCNSGRPASFMDVPIQQVLIAWRGSIDRAEGISPLGGIMTGTHFVRLAEARHSAGGDTREDTAAIDEFLSEEEERIRRLRPKVAVREEEVSSYVDLLQFCDVLSLYLCCGSGVPVAFAQTFKGQALSLTTTGGVARLTPSPFEASRPLSFEVNAFRYPGGTSSTLKLQVE